MVNVIFYEGAMDKYLNSPEGEVGSYLGKKGRSILRAAKKKVGVRSGALRSSIHMRHLRDPRGQYVRIGSDLSYALMHHEGTRPHKIAVGRDQKMRFVSKGAIVYATVVDHPGTDPNPYLRDALIENLRT